MAYGIYFTLSNSNDNHQTKTTVWYNDFSFTTLKAAKEALEGVAEMLNEEFYTITYKDSLRLAAERTDNKPQPTTERVVYHIEKR